MNQPMQLPASIASRARRGTLTSMTQGLGISSPPRISIKAQRFTLVDSAGTEIPVNLFDQGGVGIYLDVVIIGANPHSSKQFYEFEYDPTKDDAPACFSDNGIAPSSQAITPQSQTCAACPNNAWGSATSKMTGKPTKACSDRKKLAVLVVGDPELAYQFLIPPASLKNLRAYADTLRQHQVTDAQGQRPADPADVITRVYFNPAKQGELLFAGVAFVDDGLVALTEKADASGVIDVLVGANDVPFQGALPAPQAPQQLPSPADVAAAQMLQIPTHVPFVTAAVAAQQPAFGAPQAQPNGGGAPPPPAPRSRRGGARAGAGRPAQEQAPAQAPSVAPFVQPAAAPMAPTASAPFPSPSGAPLQQGIPTPSPSGGATNASPSSGPILFAPRAAAPANPGVQEGIPAFLQRQAPAPQAPPPQGAPAFGMQSAPQPSPELTAAIDRAFTTPLTPRPRG